MFIHVHVVHDHGVVVICLYRSHLVVVITSLKLILLFFIDYFPKYINSQRGKIQLHDPSLHTYSKWKTTADGSKTIYSCVERIKMHFDGYCDGGQSNDYKSYASQLLCRCRKADCQGNNTSSNYECNCTPWHKIKECFFWMLPKISIKPYPMYLFICLTDPRSSGKQGKWLQNLKLVVYPANIVGGGCLKILWVYIVPL